MKHIANILSTEPFDGWELYNIVKDPEEVEDGIPTLIVGWEKAKSLCPNASIIEWNISKDIYWTYGKYERREKYEENVKKFLDIVFKRCIEMVSYKFYDVMLWGADKFETFLKLLSDSSKKTVYVSGDMLYVNFDRQSSVIGLSLRDCDYFDETYRKRIFSEIYGNKSVMFLKNNDAISRETRYRTRGNIYIIPYLFSETE